MAVKVELEKLSATGQEGTFRGFGNILKVVVGLGPGTFVNIN